MAYTYTLQIPILEYLLLIVNLFDDFGSGKEQKENEQKLLDKELKAQEAIMKIKKKYGKNAVIKGMSLQDESTIRERNNQIGGHKA